MAKRRAKHPFENNPFTDAFLEWMGSSEGERSVYALDLVFAALENADVDPKRRKIVWDDGKRLSARESRVPEEFWLRRLGGRPPFYRCPVVR